MTEQEQDRIIEENKEVVIEMIAFWVWIKGLNTIFKWLALTGIPISVSVWAALKWIKSK